MRASIAMLGLLAMGCAETVGATSGDAATTEACPGRAPPPTGMCERGLGPSQTIDQVEELRAAVRADGDRVAFFWRASSVVDQRLMVRRYEATGVTADAQPVVLPAPLSRDIHPAVAWDPVANEPVVLAGGIPGAATLYRGGLGTTPTERRVELPTDGTDPPPNGVYGLRATADGLTFFSRTPGTTRALRQWFVAPDGSPRSTRLLDMAESINVTYAFEASLLDQSELLFFMSGESQGALVYQRLDAHGDPLGPSGSWRGAGQPLQPPLAATCAGYLFARQVSASVVSLTAYDRAGVAQGTAREFSLPANSTAVGMVGAHGHAFLVEWTPSGAFGRAWLQEVNAAGPVGAPLALEGSLGLPERVGMVPTSSGGLLYFGNTSGIQGVGLRVAPLRLCD